MEGVIGIDRLRCLSRAAALLHGPTICVEMSKMTSLHRNPAFYQLLADSYAQQVGAKCYRAGLWDV
jgi:hypothetical protein